MALNISNLVFPGHFEPKTDRWCDYKDQILCALDAAGLRNDHDKARAVFLSQCGKQTYGLVASLLVPLKPSDVKFLDILAVLDQFYEPEVNEILQAGRFHKRQQLEGESVQEFVAAIGLLATKCKFVDLKRQLRDRLVLGVRDDRLRRELLKTKDLSYETAVQMCLNYQATFPDLYPNTEIKQTPSRVNEPMEIDKIQSNECRHCARVHKPGDRCSFMKSRCFYCKKQGHIAAACAKKAGKVHQVNDGGESSASGTSEEKMMGIYVCSESYQPPITVNVTIDGAQLPMEVDSGASRSIISEATYKRLWLIPPLLHPTDIKLVTWTRDPLKVLGLANVRAVLGDKEGQCELLVVSGSGPSLLGRNWFGPLALHINGLCWSEEEIGALKSEYPEVFKGGLGEYVGPAVSLHVRRATPRFLKARAVPFPLKNKVNDELNQVVKDGVLTPIEYSQGATPLMIGNVDSLSRWTAPNGSGVKLDEPLREVLLLDERPDGWNIDDSKIAAETKKDPLLQKVLFHVLHGWPNRNVEPSLQPFWVRREALSHDKECLLWSNRVVVPTSLRQHVLSLLHEPHAGIVQTKAYARGNVWWPDIDRNIETMVAECELCQAVRNSPTSDPQSWIVPEKPWSRLHIDFAGPFQGKTFLVLIDSHSNWFEAEIVPSMSTASVVTVLRKIFASHGLPDTLVSDNGKAFTSEEFNLFLRNNGIRHLYPPPYHPATNGQIERAIQTFKDKIKKSDVNLAWNIKLSRVLYHMRTMPSSVTGKSPAEMLMGRRFRTAVTALHPAAAPNHELRQHEAAAQRASAKSFTLGQPVLARAYTAGDKWLRAHVHAVEGPAAYVVMTEDGQLHRRHIDQLLSRSASALPPVREPIVNRPRSSSSSEPDPPIVIPDPELWPDIIGIPVDDSQ